MRADTPQSTPPLPKQLARRLLRLSAGDRPSAEALAAAAADAYRRLRAHLSVFLGDQGFDTLWRRAVRLARREFLAWDDVMDEQAPLALPPGVSSALHRDAVEAEARLLAVFANFIALLFTFIGERLGVRLINQAWSDLPLDTVEPPAEELT